MKICPVCKAGAFDDAQVCYGCMHKFTPQDALPSNATAERKAQALNDVPKEVKPAKPKVAQEVEKIEKVESEAVKAAASTPEADSCNASALEEKSSGDTTLHSTTAVPIKLKRGSRRRGAPARSVSVPLDSNANVVVRIEVLGAGASGSNCCPAHASGASAVAL